MGNVADQLLFNVEISDKGQQVVEKGRWGDMQLRFAFDYSQLWILEGLHYQAKWLRNIARIPLFHEMRKDHF